MKILLLIVILYFLPESERPIDDKDCELWKYHDSQAERWCLQEDKPQIIRELE